MFDRDLLPIWTLFPYLPDKVATIKTFSYEYVIDRPDVIINVTIESVGESVDIPDSCLYTVNVFGSGNADGTGPREILDSKKFSHSQLNITRNENFQLIYDWEKFDVSKVGCGDTEYLCLELKLCDSVSSDSLMTSDGGEAIVQCESQPCTGGLINQFYL